MKRMFTGKWTPQVAPLTAAITLSLACSDNAEEKTLMGTLVETSDAGVSSGNTKAGSGEEQKSSSSASARSSSDDARADNGAPRDTSPASQSDADADADRGAAPASASADKPSADATVDPIELDLALSQLGSAGSFVDFDGDDQPDQLVGAPHAQREGGIGAALVYKGTDQGWSQAPSATLVGDRDFGYAVADVGDVDADGKRDYAVGAPHGDAEDVSLAGSVSVFAGGSQGKRLLAKLTGTTAASKYGLSVAGGDFNGDGSADVVVGAPFHTPASDLYQTGAVFVHFGPRLDKSHALLASASAKGLGWAVAAGDLNGDGIDDLVLSATSSAKVMVFFGKPGFAPTLDKPDVAFTSKASGFGKTLAVVSDFNGDGSRELAIGAPTSVLGTERDVGSVVLAMAHGSATPVDLDASPSPHQRVLQIDGPGLFSRFGTAITSAPDVDGDGIAELVIGSPLADDQPGDLAGKVFMFSSTRISAGDGSLAKSYAGRVSYGGFGSFVATHPGGHVLVGAPRSDADHGSAHVVDLAREGVDAHFEAPMSDADAGVEGEHDVHH